MDIESFTKGGETVEHQELEIIPYDVSNFKE